MNVPRVTAHCLVKNEQRWVWFALMSVLDFVDEILVWDGSSTDATAKVVAQITSPKINYRRIRIQDPAGHTRARQQMLESTTSDWFIILDGDEVWWRDSLKNLISAIIANPAKSAIISPFYNAVGDIFHYQPPRSVHYRIHEFFGAFTIRAVNRRLPSLRVANPHGRQEYRTREYSLQGLPRDRLLFVDHPFLHLTHLSRSASRSLDRVVLKRSFKFRYELGRSFPSDFVFPEVFYLPRPALVDSPFTHRSLTYAAAASVFTPLRFLKSKVTHFPEGY